MEQQAVIDFFDRAAANWDAQLVRNEAVIGQILDNAGIRPGVSVLDIKAPRLIQFNYSSADFAA